jgi:hypothetical protein
MDMIAAALFVPAMRRMCCAENRLWGFEKVQLKPLQVQLFQIPMLWKGLPADAP